MLQNVGYMNAHVVRKRFTYYALDEVSQRQLNEMLKEGEAIMHHPSVEEVIRDDRPFYRRRDRHCGAAFGQFLEDQKLFLSGPAGVVPIDHSIFEVHWLPRARAKPTKAVPVGKNVFEISPEAEAPWTFLDGKYMSVRCRERVADLTAARRKLVSAENSPLEQYELDLLREKAALEPIARRLLPHEGWCLAISAEDEPGRATIRKYLGLVDERRVGRPKKKTDAVEAYRQLFPDGHEGKRHKEVLRAIEARTGIRVSWTTLEDGLKELRSSN